MFSHVARLRAKKGFTLIELIIVMAIIGILTAMILPNIIYDKRPATGKAMAKDLYYTIQDVLTSAKIANPDEIPEDTVVYFYMDVGYNGFVQDCGRVVAGSEGGSLKKDAFKDDLVLDRNIEHAMKKYTTDKDQMEGTLYAVVDSNYRVLAAYWSDQELSGLLSAKIRQECVLDSGYLLCSYPVKYCDTLGKQIFAVDSKDSSES